MSEEREAIECDGGGTVPARRSALPSAGDVGVCAVCGETLLLDDEGLLPRHYRPGARRNGHESVAPDA